MPTRGAIDAKNHINADKLIGTDNKKSRTNPMDFFYNWRQQNNNIWDGIYR